MTHGDAVNNIFAVELPPGSKNLETLDGVSRAIRNRPLCRLAVDFANVDVLSSEGIMRLLNLRDQLMRNKGGLVLTRVSPATRNVFLVTGLDNVFEFADDAVAPQATV
ncbi:MAG: STAS domain-containing protein [Sedimentisphaerales bacterium]|nr:STAS domain-containing protein [Sedimentisphaerales bacterium]